MKRASVIVLSSDPAAAIFVDGLLGSGTADDRAVAVDSARTAIAMVSGPVRCRLLLIDDPPPDLVAGSLIEAARLVDPKLAILFLRHGWEGPPAAQDGVEIRPGPLRSAENVAVLQRLLDASER